MNLRKAVRKRNRCSSFQYSNNYLHLLLEGVELIFVHPENGAHTIGDTILFMPKKNIIFTGDIVYNSFFPNLTDAHIDSWLDTLSGIDLNTYRKLLPGHGEVCGKNELQEFSGYLKQVREKLLAINLKEANQIEIRSCLEVQGTEDWKLRSAIDRNVMTITGYSPGAQ